MTRKQKQIGVILCLLGIAAFTSWPLYKYFHVQAASATRQAQVKALADQNPQLKAAWDKAMSDQVLTEDEATAIEKQSSEKTEPGK